MAPQLTATKGLTAPAAQLVEGTGRQLLARPALAADQNARRGIGHPGDLLVEIDHHRGRADELRFFADLPLALRPELPEFPDLEHLLDHRPDRVRRKGFADVIPGAQPQRLHRRFQRAEGRHQDDGQLRPPFVNLPEKLETIHFRHPDVGQQEIELRQVLRQGLPRGGEGIHFVSRPQERLLEKLTGHGVVVDHEDADLPALFTQAPSPPCTAPGRPRGRNSPIRCRTRPRPSPCCLGAPG